ncbi:AzlC family ABC transporter permease [Ralstonia pseudosolanacearum]|uniref:Predicted branched-chain amino acid permease (Azaleucine resistance) transmembrane protein n=1 Tax=Ralstonia nicotianae (strain ATCC BAA-1114 / GMI1000) TaxID=267608 RepID=Q8XQB0_RALN1|nr:AzlC family ABC transporter permease [Ralstonia pseudosolanacearum]MDC6285171.1 AzlC family ABC transporter permease [Ralstonia pseudosolanacearum]CAD18527.1 putative predicted branched-chain amino acid permease (azaleucine resistance) transmembrane protein [Ralstonia pseudosolanacearum GMI1000]
MSAFINQAAACAGDHAPRSAAQEARRGLRASLPVLLGFIPFALVLGAQATQKGLSVMEVPLMTGLNFGGGSEFTAIRLWTSPPHLLLIAAMSLLVNSRHLLMGAALAPYLRHVPRRRALAALFFMCDESWALALADAQSRATGRISLGYYLGVSAGLYLTWVVFTAIGAALGPVIGDVERYGFDMAFTAVFLVLLRGMWRGLRASRPWLASLAAAALTYRLMPDGAWYVAAGALAGLACAALTVPKEARA